MGAIAMTRRDFRPEVAGRNGTAISDGSQLVNRARTWTAGHTVGPWLGKVTVLPGFCRFLPCCQSCPLWRHAARSAQLVSISRSTQPWLPRRTALPQAAQLLPAARRPRAGARLRMAPAQPSSASLRQGRRRFPSRRRCRVSRERAPTQALACGRRPGDWWPAGPPSTRRCLFRLAAPSARGSPGWT